MRISGYIIVIRKQGKPFL